METKSILIISEKDDLTTYHVAKELEELGQQVVILTDEDVIRDFEISNRKIVLKNGKHDLDFGTIKAYWYRRGDLKLWYGKTRNREINQILSDEMYTIGEYIHYKLSKIPSLGNVFFHDYNRLVALDIASGWFDVPDFLVTRRRSGLKSFRKQHERIVTKAIKNGINTVKGQAGYVSLTTEIDDEDIKGMRRNFFPSMVMKYIGKKIEIRVFYLDGQCYSMAILSQNDAQTCIDYRNYNHSKPNRNVPVKLPGEVEKKICRLMKALRLVSGSLDFILTPDDRFVFLEVNPVGQFLNVSHSCNYNLEREIARYLIKISS